MSDDDTPDELTEAVKAVQEVAKTTSKSIDVVQDLGKFVARFVGGTLEQASGMVEDKLKYLRWERQAFLHRLTSAKLHQHVIAVHWLPCSKLPSSVDCLSHS